ncbi:MAG: hypothetical protein WD076_11535 [Parvularculaceae bacterium]
MASDRYGLIGGLVADRPVVVSLVMAFGLTALAVAGVADPSAALRASASFPEFIIAILAYSTIPAMLAAATPRRLGPSLFFVGLVWMLFVVAPIFAPFAAVAPAAFSLNAGATLAALTTLLIMSGPVVGATIRFAFVASASAALGMAGAMGMMELDRIGGEAAGPVATIGFGLGAFVGIGAAADFAMLFARGAEAKRAAGVAARYGLAPAIYAAILAASAYGLAYFVPQSTIDALSLAGAGGAAAFLASVSALFATAGSLSLRRPIETLAVRENKRQQSFRKFWRPFRRLLPPSSAMAFAAILGIATIAAVFNLEHAVSPTQLVFIVIAAAASSVVFLSVRAGLFVLALLGTGSVFLNWFWDVARAPALTQLDEIAACALAAALFAQLAVAWREARNPRLNARETTEAALSDVVPPYVVCVIMGAAGMLGAEASGLWLNGAAVSARFLMLALYGLLIAPAVMTTLSRSSRRDYA